MIMPPLPQMEISIMFLLFLNEPFPKQSIQLLSYLFYIHIYIV